MPDDLTLINNTTERRAYQIRLKGHLSADWAEWFGNSTITPTESGESLITTSCLDQAALFGLLKKVRDLGLILIALNSIDEMQKE